MLIRTFAAHDVTSRHVVSMVSRGVDDVTVGSFIACSTVRSLVRLVVRSFVRGFVPSLVCSFRLWFVLCSFVRLFARRLFIIGSCVRPSCVISFFGSLLHPSVCPAVCTQGNAEAGCNGDEETVPDGGCARGRSMSRYIARSIHRSIDRSIDCSIDRSIHQSIHYSIE